MKVSIALFLTGVLCLSASGSWANELQTETQRRRAEVDRILGPLVLRAELSPDSLQVLVDDRDNGS